MTSDHKVLLLDDNDLNRTLARTIITRCDAPVIRAITLLEADSLAQARTVLADTPVELLLLDLHLPDGNGLTLARDLTARDERPIIIAVTASVLPEDLHAVEAAGCDGFIGKPYRPQQLIDTLTTHLSGPPTGEWAAT